MICENCGAQIADDVLTVYCKKCGHKILREDAAGPEAEKQEEPKPGKSRRKWYVAAGCGAMMLTCIVVLLVVMQGPEAFRNAGGHQASGSEKDTIERLYGEWADESGIISMTFLEDGTVRIGAGAGFFGADLFTFTEEGGDTLYLKANAKGVLGAVSLQMEYELHGDTMAISLLGMDYILKRK